MFWKQQKNMGCRLVAALAFCVGILSVQLAAAQGASQAGSRQAAAGSGVGRDEYQRSADIYRYQTAAQSGPARGEEIYYYKCWVCHNKYTQGGPHLKDIFKRPTLTSGGPISDQTVRDQIRNGGPGMPRFGTTLADADLADLISYFKDSKCCFEGDEPPSNPRYRATQALPSQSAGGQAQNGRKLLGGPRGAVRSARGEPLEGIRVQLIAHKNAIRTTVYSDEAGQYEFPPLASGTYTLRVARPLEFRPYVKEPVEIDGAAPLEPIVLERVSEGELLPPTPEIAAQLAGADWLMNLPGTGQEKRTFTLACGAGCHSYQQIFRNRYDEHSWRMILDRMLHYAGSPLINRTPDGRLNDENEALLAQWLARVRGPDSKDQPFQVLPPPRGAATRVIITEYELPRTLLAPHDVHGDSKGNIWYSAHRSPYFGKLDPRTGMVTEYHAPGAEGALPGTHRMWVDPKDTVWVTEHWSHKLTALDPATGKFRQLHMETGAPINSPTGANFAMDSQGYVYSTLFNAVTKIDSKTGQVVTRYPFTKIRATYDNMISFDGRFWSGGQSGSDLIGLLDLQTGRMEELRTRAPMSYPARGGFDRQGNAWYGGRGGQILRVDSKTKKITEYTPPTPYVTFYEAMPDKNGEVWAGELHGGRFLRFNPRTERWIEYVMPEPYSHDRRTWIDNSTDPVTIWYVDHNGYMVRIQPLE